MKVPAISTAWIIRNFAGGHIGKICKTTDTNQFVIMITDKVLKLSRAIQRAKMAKQNGTRFWIIH